MRYKGYTLSNISDTPSIPLYGIFDPQGEPVTSTWFPSEFKKIVNAIIKNSKTKKM